MITLTDNQLTSYTDVFDSQINADNVKNQGDRADEIEPTEDEDDEDTPDDEPIDEDGDPTGEHDHHQDDNYALGGHVTRSGGA